MSSTRQNDARPPSNLTAFGNRPERMPAHQVDFFIGIKGGTGGFAFGSPIICLKRKKPVSGSWFIFVLLRFCRDSAILNSPFRKKYRKGFALKDIAFQVVWYLVACGSCLLLGLLTRYR